MTKRLMNNNANKAAICWNDVNNSYKWSDDLQRTQQNQLSISSIDRQNVLHERDRSTDALVLIDGGGGSNETRSSGRNSLSNSSCNTGGEAVMLDGLAHGSSRQMIISSHSSNDTPTLLTSLWRKLKNPKEKPFGEKILSPHVSLSSVVINHDEDNASEPTMSTTAPRAAHNFYDEYHPYHLRRGDNDGILSSLDGYNSSRDKNYHKLDSDPTTPLIMEEVDLDNSENDNDLDDNEIGVKARIEPKTLAADFACCQILTETTFGRHKCDEHDLRQQSLDSSEIDNTCSLTSRSKAHRHFIVGAVIMKKKSANGRSLSEDTRMTSASVNNVAGRMKEVNITNVPLEMLGCNETSDTAPPSQPPLLTDYRHPTSDSSASSLSTVGGVTAQKLRDKCRHRSGAVMVMSCSRLHLLIALLFCVGTIFTSVFITYVVTKEKVEQAHVQHGENEPSTEGIATAAAQKGAIVGTSSSINYDDEFKRILSSKSFIKFNDDDEPFNEDLQSDSNHKGVNEPTADELLLADNLNPMWYNLTLQVYVPGFVEIAPEKNLTFAGTVTTKFRVKKSTKTIELNALKLNFPGDLSSIEIFQEDVSEVSKQRVSLIGAGIKIVNVSVNESLEKVFFELDTALAADAEYIIKIPYSGPIAKKLSGLYLTQYTSMDGRQRYAAVTQMEPTDARRMVPCWDEPAFKAIWRLTVTHPRGSKAVSNAIELLEDQLTKDSDWITTKFDDTLPMSSYLLALVVSDFQYVEGYTSKHTRFRIWARRDALNLTSYALHAGIKVLQFYEDYYGIPFPLPKQDMMAFPDFAAGAMENWGLVTYREKYLLYSPDYYTLLQKMAVASVVSHELAHQWFGNLVTMKWWSDLWLNEGFATLMEYLGTNAISDGSFRMEEYFLIESLDSAFDRDARATSHPLYFEIDRAEDVTEAFDSITYSKGASVLRMIHAVMGEEYFKKGLNIYLNRYKYSNAEHKNLWDALTEAVPNSLRDWSGSQFDVSDFAQSWTEQMGYPVVEVERVGPQRIMLTQHRFKLDETAQEKPKFQNAKFGYKWKIPIWYNVNGTEKNMTWLHEKTRLNIGDDDILVVNSDSYGYYRVQYSKKTLDSIANQLLTDHNKISVKSRSRIIDDTFTLAQAGRLPYEAALNLTRYLLQEKEFLPWEAALNGLSIIQTYFDDEPETDYLRAYVKQIIGDLFEKEVSEVLEAKKFSNSSKFFQNLLSIRIIQRMCSLRDPECITKINTVYQDLFVKPCKSPNKKTHISSQCSLVPVPLRTLTYCEGVHYGTEMDYEMMMSLYEHETVQVERERLMQALACSRDTHTLKKLLALASDINSTVIRLQDKPSVFMHVSSRTIGKKVVVDFFIDHWQQIYKDFKEQQTLLRSIISNSIVGTSQRLINEVEKFVSDNEKTTRNLDIFKQRLEVIRTSRKWMEQNFQPLSDWFHHQQKIALSGK